jgi:pyruvate/2-oxoglutarate dehydrogenase complex dihydrolipoamide acyltransferase (E2) component
MSNPKEKSTTHNNTGYHIEPYPKIRRMVVDSGRMGRRRHTIHALIEVDVTPVRRAIKDHKERTGEGLSFTGYIIYCLGKAVEAHPHVHAMKDWRGRLVIFDDVDTNTYIERKIGEHRLGMVYVIRAVNLKSFREIHSEIRAGQAGELEHVARIAGREKLLNLFLSLPSFVRMAFWTFIRNSPWRMKEMLGTIAVTSVGMFGKGGGWGFSMPWNTLTVTLGGITEKPSFVGDEVEARQFLDMTLSLDHDIVDGAPITRFINTFKEIIESGQGLEL